MSKNTAPIHKWISARLSNQMEHSLQRWSRTNGVCYIAVMPDAHLAKNVCIGTVIATKNIVYPVAVGGDIGCGILAVGFNDSADRFRDEQVASRLLDELYKAVPQNRHPSRTSCPMLTSDLQNDRLSDSRLEKVKDRDGRVQLGTLGRGNHFLELQYDLDDRLWLMIHSGSRGIGQAIAKHHGADTRRGLHGDSDQAQSYLQDVRWARKYATENRLAMMHTVADIMFRNWGITADYETIVHTDHNHVQVEKHDNQNLFVHRKGAQRLAIGELGLVPGSMGTYSMIVAGKGSKLAMMSCAHGAGRKMSRQEARRKVNTTRFEDSMSHVWFDKRMSAQLVDEAPEAYKDLKAVMRDQRDLVKPVRKLRPLLSFKGH